MNAKNFKATIDYIEAHPDEYDQQVWACSVRCFGGTAEFLMATDGKINSIGEVITWLGLTEEVADYLFDNRRTWPEILKFYEEHCKV